MSGPPRGGAGRLGAWISGIARAVRGRGGAWPAALTRPPFRPALAPMSALAGVAAWAGSAGWAAPRSAAGTPAPPDIGPARPVVRSDGAGRAGGGSGGPPTWSFAEGEAMRFEVRFGRLRVGRGAMEVVGVEDVRGRPAWHMRVRIKGRALTYRLDDTYDSWVDTLTRSAVRFVKTESAGSRPRLTRYEIHPDRGVYTKNAGPEAPTVEAPLDDASFLYFVRSVALADGEAYEFARYFKADRNPVGVRVLRRERVRVPAGSFDAVVLRPSINTSGFLGKARKTELWLSDDDRRAVVRLKFRLPVGSVTLSLTSYQPGAPPSRSRTPIPDAARSDAAPV